MRALVACVAFAIACGGDHQVVDGGSDASSDVAADGPISFPDASFDAPADATDAAEATSYSALDDKSKYSTFDLQSLTSSARGYQGAVFDGKYIYFVPHQNISPHGIVGRYDTTATFTSAASWGTFDMSAVNANLVGFGGGAFDGRYVYFAALNGFAGRYDTLSPFGSNGSWAAFDTTTLATGTGGYEGAVFDGKYVYFVPYFGGGPNTTVARYDTTASFTTAASWATFDIKTASSGAIGSIGAVFDGRYIYFVPYFNGGAPIWRYDTTAGFASVGAWSSFDVTTVSSGVPGYRSAVFDGRYVYLVPGNDGMVLLYDTKSAFTSTSSWSTFDVGSLTTSGAAFFGGAFDGRYVYFGEQILGRYDTLATFTSASSWSTFDLRTLPSGVDGGGSPGLGGLEGAAFDGRYVYYVPATSGLVVRFDAKTPPALPTGPAHGSFF